MFRSLLGFDWKKSKAHWLLLTKFINPHYLEIFTNSESWESVLNEHPTKAINRFIKEDYLVIADLEDILACIYKGSELKNMLKQRGLSVSGQKQDLIQRLITADPVKMKQDTEGLSIYICTPKGKELAEAYLVNELEKRNLVETQIIEYLLRHEFEEASRDVAAFEADQVFSRGMGIDWHNHNTSNDIKLLATIYNDKPRIVEGIAPEKYEILRLGAAMMLLWGKNTAKKWFPPDFKTGMRLSADTAARMFLFYARHRANIESYQESGVVRYIKILARDDACETCRKLNDKKFRISESPELPYEHCTHEMGCRCCVIPVVKGLG